MIEQFAMLFDYERSALIEALRRDIRSEERRAESNPQDAEYHRTNCRTTLRILETLHPNQAKNVAQGISPYVGATQGAGVATRNASAKLAKTLFLGAG